MIVQKCKCCGAEFVDEELKRVCLGCETPPISTMPGFLVEVAPTVYAIPALGLQAVSEQLVPDLLTALEAAREEKGGQ